MRSLNSLLITIFITLLFTCTSASAQNAPYYVGHFKVKASGGSAPYYPEVSFGSFEYSVEYYCDGACVIKVGGLSIPGRITGDDWNKACEATLSHYPSGLTSKIVSTAGGHLEVYDNTSGRLSVRFSAASLLPPENPTSDQLMEYYQFCIDSQIMPSF